MRQKNFCLSFIFSVAAICLVAATNQLSAQEVDIQYPIIELENCQNQSDCRLYCDKEENIEACLSFAEKNNLMTEKEISSAKKFAKAGMQGPGGCDNKESCEKYCDDINNIDECISFAEKNNLMPASELQEAKQAQAAIKRGVKPPACKGKKECDIYCEDMSHMEECISFGVEAGFIQGKELEDAKKMLSAVKRGIKPPPCKGKAECDKYCNSPDNMEVCMTFALEAGFMNEKEKEDSLKTLQALKKGFKPPACQGKEECDSYCNQEEHFEECVNFAEAAGFMDAEQAAMSRKTKGKGPGGCKGEECKTFCDNPDNQETCFNFAKENGLIPEEDLRKMEEGKQQTKQALENAPAEVLDCLKTAFGNEKLEKIKNGGMMDEKMGQKMQDCFQKMAPPQNFQPNQGPGDDMMFGPEGCKTPEECESFCKSNPDKCQNFQNQPMMSPNQQMQQPQPADMRPNMQPCQGENCQRQYAPGTFGGPSMPYCQGENCSMQNQNEYQFPIKDTFLLLPENQVLPNQIQQFQQNGQPQFAPQYQLDSQPSPPERDQQLPIQQLQEFAPQYQPAQQFFNQPPQEFQKQPPTQENSFGPPSPPQQFPSQQPPTQQSPAQPPIEQQPPVQQPQSLLQFLLSALKAELSGK